MLALHLLSMLSDGKHKINNMSDRFLGIIEESMRQYWDTPAFSDYKGPAYYYKDMAREIEYLHLVLEQAGIRRATRWRWLGVTRLAGL